MIRSSAELLMSVINDILDFSKIEAGKLDLEAIEFELRPLLEETLRPMALRAHRKGLELNCDIQADVPEFVVGDPGRLRQVIFNLVGNAIKFTESGEVGLQVKLRGHENDEYQIEFAVIDTGIGVAPERQQAIFAPFSQADGSTTRRFGGTGLGLTISSQLVALMGGQIEIESKIGLGSTFRFCARFKRPLSLFTQPSVGGSTDLRGIAVLVVDDNATNRRILEEMLRRWDARPTAVDSGAAALAEMRRAIEIGEPYPLVLVDAVMPEMDGFALVERIRQDPTFAPPTIMMLTSADRKGDTNRCRNLGLAAYLVKPIKAAELRDAITSCLDTNHPGPSPKLLAPGRTSASPAPGETAVAPLRILLAEDNPVNQRVALHLLNKQRHATTVVGNGKEALAALEQQEYDLVLMDVQMPEMDGFEATRAVRAKEATTGRRLPIIAMTAHAMKGDRERCLAAGMDDYVSKPVHAGDLYRALGAIPSESRASAHATKDQERQPRDQKVLDREAALERLGGDASVLHEIFNIFLEDFPGKRDELRSAASAGDFLRMRRALHGLKGAIGYLAAGPANDATNCLEQAAEAGDLLGTADALATLEQRLDELTDAVGRLASAN
jgi:CheY-like chemotaxis protein